MSGNPYTSAQAPAYNLIAPDIGAEQAKLARQQQMADILRQQSLEPMGNTEMVSGWAVKKSPWESAAKLAQMLGSNYAQRGVDEKQAGLAKAMQERQMAAFDGMAGVSTQPAPAQAAQQPLDMPMDPMQVTEGAMAQPAPQSAPAQAPAAPKNPKIDGLINQARAAYILGNKELSNKIIENISLMTEGQRTDNYLGITADQSREAELAKRTKEGTMSFQPGQLNRLPNGELIVAPDYKEGIAGGFDAKGNPIAREIEGSTQIAANRAGAVANATARANAGQDLITVNTENGPVMMTKAQAVAQSGGGGQPAPSMPSPAPVGSAALNNMNPAQKAEFMKKAEAQFGLRPGSAPGTSVQGAAPAQAPGKVGIKLQDQGSSAFETAINNKSVDKLIESRDLARASNDQLISIAESREAFKNGAYQGFGADFKTDAMKMAQGFGIPIDDTKASNSEYLRSTLAAGILANAKKLGTNPTEGDTRLLGSILGGLGKDPQAMNKMLDLQEKMALRTIDQHNADIDSAKKSGAKFPVELSVTKYQKPSAATNNNPATNRFDAPPPAAQFTGKRMRAPDGSIMRSDGKNWVKE